jgi:hypothetical protein
VKVPNSAFDRSRILKVLFLEWSGGAVNSWVGTFSEEI